MKVNVQYAETHIAELFSSAARGEEVEVALPDGQTIKLVVSNPPPARKTGKRILGAGVGMLRIPSEEEWRAMDKEMEREMLDSPLQPRVRFEVPCFGSTIDP
jgi:antitoxin (DNA-binding transcriptional repressor) of toxin-antitoxin stability system